MTLFITAASFLFVLMVALQIRVYRQLKKQARLVRLQQQRHERQKQLLEELISEKQQLISLVSHDLKGPFNRIFALIQLLSMTPDNLTGDQLNYIGKIHQISSDGLSMIRNLLDNRRLEDKGIDLLVENLNLSKLVSTLVKNYTALAEKKKITVFFEKSADIIMQSDKLTLNRIVENLLSNALKFSYPEKNIWITLSCSEMNCELKIIDQGPGIGKEDQTKLFQKYQRLAARPTAGESSTGLGLYLVKNMVEKLGGTVSYFGDVGRGSEFSIVLPLHAPLSK